MTSQLAAKPDLLGAQRPRHLWVPEYVSSSGLEAIELARMVGLEPDDWQQFVITEMLGELPNGQWAAREVGLEVPRQNGKGGVYEIRELAGLFLLGERQLIHSAHEYKTAEQALDRMEALIEGAPDLSRRVRTIKRSHGQEGIYLKTGQVLRYFTRTSSGGRGFSCDFLGLDEAMKIKHSMHAAMFPTMAARPNPQILYAGSAVDEETMEDGLVFARIRERGIKGDDPRLAYFGWSAPFDHPDDVTEEAARDPENWAAGNPAFGIRVMNDYIEMEQRALSARGFAVERLGVGAWPSIDKPSGQVFSDETWSGLTDVRSVPDGSVCFVYDVRPDRSWSAIGAAGRRADGLWHIEVIEHKPGTAWVAARLDELVTKHDPIAVGYALSSPAAALSSEVEELGVELTPLSPQQHAEGCGLLYDAVDQLALRHLGTPELAASVKGAVKRSLGDGAWTWSRKGSAVDISPLVSCTLALWGAANLEPRTAAGIEIWA